MLSKRPWEANIGKPVTRVRKAITESKHNRFPQHGFKILPKTPKASRIPKWKPGSGFEGITFDIHANSGRPRSKPPRTKHVHVAVPSSRALELSTMASSSNQGIVARPVPQQDQASPAQPNVEHPSHGRVAISPLNSAEPAPAGLTVDGGDHATLDRMGDSTTPLQPPSKPSETGTSDLYEHLAMQRPKSLNRGEAKTFQEHIDNEQVREPSKSERQGWLKRRKRVSFATEAARHVSRCHNYQKAYESADSHYIIKDQTARTEIFQRDLRKAEASLGGEDEPFGAVKPIPALSANENRKRRLPLSSPVLEARKQARPTEFMNNSQGILLDGASPKYASYQRTQEFANGAAHSQTLRSPSSSYCQHSSSTSRVQQHRLGTGPLSCNLGRDANLRRGKSLKHFCTTLCY